jgi:membrane protease subunit HflC
MTVRQRAILITVTLVAILLIPLVRATLFTVDERELAVVLQFGEPVASYTEPGLKVKIPFVQQVRKLPRSLQVWSGTGRQVLEDLPTADGKRIEVSAWAIWRITDPEQFVRVLKTVDNAEIRVATFVRGETRNVITSNDLVEVVRSTNRELKYPVLTELLKILEEGHEEDKGMDVGPARPTAGEPEGGQPDGGEAAPAAESDEESLQEWVMSQTATRRRKVEVGRQEIVEQIKEIVHRKLSEGDESGHSLRGIELVDVGISRIDFVPRVREAAFNRQIARWEAIASFYTNQGEKRKRQILNRTEARVQEILGEGKQQANEIRGEVEARIIDSYAEAIRETGEFYNFVRTLEAYEAAMGPNTRMILTTDSSLLGLLKDVGQAQVPAEAPPAAGGTTAAEGTTTAGPPD